MTITPLTTLSVLRILSDAEEVLTSPLSFPQVIFCSSVDAVESVTYKLGSRAIEALALVRPLFPSLRVDLGTDSCCCPLSTATLDSQVVMPS